MFYKLLKIIIIIISHLWYKNIIGVKNGKQRDALTPPTM